MFCLVFNNYYPNAKILYLKRIIYIHKFIFIYTINFNFDIFSFLSLWKFEIRSFICRKFVKVLLKYNNKVWSFHIIFDTSKNYNIATLIKTEVFMYPDIGEWKIMHYSKNEPLRLINDVGKLTENSSIEKCYSITFSPLSYPFSSSFFHFRKTFQLQAINFLKEHARTR